MPVALTARAVENMRADPHRRLEIPDGALPGFYLVVQPSGAKSWAVRYRMEGRSRKLTLGPYPRLSLAHAREQAQAALRLVSAGRDPSEQRALERRKAEEAVALRFQRVVGEYIERYAKPRNRTWRETERLLTRSDLAAWQERDLRSISRQEIVDVLDGMVERGAPVQANRLLAALRRFYGWTLERGLLDASPLVTIRPPSPETARDRVLSDAELASVWRAAATMGYPFGHSVQLMILTGQRRSEVLEAEWDEFDLRKAVWRIPRTRAKNDVGHIVPLAPAAIEILRNLPRVGSPPRLVFTTNGSTPFSGISKALTRLASLSESEAHPEGYEPWRLHDFRRTFATGCARLGVPLHVVEKCLNHLSGSFNGIVAVYQRHDYLEERREAHRLWAEHVAALSACSPSRAGERNAA